MLHLLFNQIYYLYKLDFQFALLTPTLAVLKRIPMIRHHRQLLHSLGFCCYGVHPQAVACMYAPIPDEHDAYSCTLITMQADSQLAAYTEGPRLHCFPAPCTCLCL